MPRRHLEWSFPLPRTHTGPVLANGVQGLMVWGTDRLRITVGRAGFWDHRGGTVFDAGSTFSALRPLVEAGDEAGIAELLGYRRGSKLKPRQLGTGRVDVTLPERLVPERAVLDLDRARITVTVANGESSEQLVLEQAIDEERAFLTLPASLAGRLGLEAVPAWDHIGSELAETGIEPPERFEAESGALRGFTQSLPEDPGVALAVRDEGAVVTVATALGTDPGSIAPGRASAADAEAAQERARAWWADRARARPVADLPDPVAQEAFDYGLHKLAGLTAPGGVAATLQGPWLEEYRLPAWGSDYHFNINLQMIYRACLPTNHLAHMEPLWDLVRAWWPRLAENGRCFFEADGAVMLPHAVDDRCQVVGQFWTGTIDHGCTAWTALLAWRHYRYGGEDRVRERIARPLLVGAFEGYWAMMEQRSDGSLALPVSVSPEFGGASIDAWGANASFQLAACHAVVQALEAEAAEQGRAADPRWGRVREALPHYARYDDGGGERIALWEGQDLSGSHRHHSHLAAIYPFCSIDPASPEHAGIVANSIRHWVATGAGAWSGWCVPWASILHGRLDDADAAVHWLHWWHDNFTNEGRGTLHDAITRGASAIATPPPPDDAPIDANNEVMQIEAACGALTAVCELLVQTRGDRVVVLPAVPRRWRELRFDGIRAEGGFLIGATVASGARTEVRVEATRAGALRLAHGLGAAYTVNGEPGPGTETLETTLAAGDRLVLRPALAHVSN